MNAQDEAALQLWQANRNNPEIERLFDDFFGCVTKTEFNRQMSCVEAEFPICVISTSPLSSPSSGAL